METVNRKPFVAGQFYPENLDSLSKMLKGYCIKDVQKNILGALVPHAGYIYSGEVAGKVYSLLKPKKYYIILGPNHSGYGPRFSLFPEGSWITPLGSVKISSSLIKKIITIGKNIEIDTSAHMHEHSIEVQLPFLQYTQNNFEIVALSLSDATLGQYQKLAEDLFTATKDNTENIAIIASSDMSHYVPHEVASEKDKKIIDSIVAIDPEDTYRNVSKYNVSMCGYGPCVVMLFFAKLAGAKKGELISYQTSAKTSRDYSSVVGYAGIAIS